VNIPQCQHLNQLAIHKKWIEAGQQVFNLLGNEAPVSTPQRGLEICRGLFQHLLDEEMYLEAATLQWGPDMFNTEPESTVRVFKALQEGSLILLMGASSMSKTFAAGGFYLLDYLRDPLYTTVKLAAINEDHLKKNLFAHVANLLRNCAIPSKYDIQVRDTDLWMGVKEAGYSFGIAGIAFKQSQETSGQFKGYKVLPMRRTPHPKFGVMSRIRVLGDEGQNWPGGPFKDFNSLIASKSGSDLVKVAVAFNPENVSQHAVQLAEPEHGWTVDDLDRLYDYESKAGWRVCRMDAALSENVKQRKLIYPGLQTYEGYLSYLKSGGDNSPNYFTFARGFPPMGGSVNTLIPPDWPNKTRGHAFFIDNPVTLASVDLAFMGKDSAQMAIARWGLASSWTDADGRRHMYKDRLDVNRDKPRHVLQIEQVIPMEKHDNTTQMAEEIMGRCKQMKIPPTWCVLDKTGIGLGTYSHLQKVWGDVLGVSWNEGATEGKITSDDQEGADKQCDGVMSEMWWALRQWMNPTTGAVLMNPIIPSQPLYTQLTSRRFKHSKKGIKVEPKDEYRARNANASPDEADAIVMLIHLVRRSGKVLPGLVEEEPRERFSGVTNPEFRSARETVMQVDEDSISPDGDEKELA
jgi:hypothetical protein